MASIQSLTPLIYHEKQQEGSMLCAQHALNSLLQGPYFTAADLSSIASTLDSAEQEHRYDEGRRGNNSTNMDDTGFFSVQVLERALQVWGLTLVRWRSEAMKPCQDHPHTQMAFILNCNQHWYTLRRFGPVSPDPSIEAEPGEGHWFNLNSFLPRPERVSKLYLGMVLHQAEQEGYSVFAVIQIDPTAPLALPRTEADELAASVTETSASAPESSSAPEALADFGDEDMELQAALQASLMDHDAAYYAPPPPIPAPPPHRSFTVPIATPGSGSGSGVRTPTQPRRGYSLDPERMAAPEEVEQLDDDEDIDVEEIESPGVRQQYFPRRPFGVHPNPRANVNLDPLEASRARSQAFMDAMMRQQEMAMQETLAEERARVAAGVAPRRRPTREQQEEEELQRAIEASRALHEAQQAPSGSSNTHNDSDEEDEEQYMDAEDSGAFEPLPQRESPPPVIPPRPRPSYEEHRVYDDDDAELQAALKASLETVPEGFRLPSTPPRPQPPSLNPSGPSESGPSSSHLQPPAATNAGKAEDTNSEAEVDTESEAESSVVMEEPEVSLEEMRKRRLAKFGG